MKGFSESACATEIVIGNPFFSIQTDVGQDIVNFMGAFRNYPVIRDASIALIPDEPVSSTTHGPDIQERNNKYRSLTQSSGCLGKDSIEKLFCCSTENIEKRHASQDHKAEY